MNRDEYSWTKRFGGLIVAVAMGLLITVALSAQEQLRKEGRYYVGEVTQSFTVQPGGKLVMRDIQGDVRVEVWAKNEVFVHEIKRMDVFTEAEARTALKETKAGYVQRGNTIEISGEPFGRGWIQSTFEVKVPKIFDVHIDTRGGDLTLSGLGGATDVSTAGGDIQMDTIDGVVVASTSGGDISVRNSSKTVTLQTAGGDIELEDIGGPVEASTSGGDIRVQNSRGRAVVRTSGGSIVLNRIGGEVQAITSGGDISVEDAKGPVEVKTSGGDIDLRNIQGPLTAKTSGGDIQANGVHVGITVMTSGGDIDLRNVNGYVEGRTSGGDVSAELRITDFKIDHHVKMSSSGGSLTLYLPEKLPATIDAEIRISDFGEDYDIYSGFPLAMERGGKEAGEKGRRPRGWGKVLRAHGDINGGGDPITLTTTNGNITIKKLSPR